MAKLINITDRLTNDKPKIIIKDKEYEVNDSMLTVLKFEELARNNTIESLREAIKVAIGEDAYNEINVDNLSFNDFKVLIIALMAAMQNMEYEDAEARFQNI
jgi:flagellar basal body-associated protein FliL